MKSSLTADWAKHSES